MADGEHGQQGSTTIGQGVKIVGTVECADGIELNGTLEGDLKCSGDVVIGKQAKIKGNMSVNGVSVAGEVHGNITAQDRIEMKASARVQGDIKAKRLTVVDGVTFVGKSEINPSGTPVAAAPQGGAQPDGGQQGGDKKPDRR